MGIFAGERATLKSGSIAFRMPINHPFNASTVASEFREWALTPQIVLRHPRAFSGQRGSWALDAVAKADFWGRASWR